jgi:hypothetical protein
VPVAQPDRASDFGSEGWGFESLQARHSLQGIYADFGGLKKKLFAIFKAKGWDREEAQPGSPLGRFCSLSLASLM